MTVGVVAITSTEASAAQETAGTLVEAANKMTDAVINARTNIFGDNAFGKFVDRINPLNLGPNELFKKGSETLKKEEENK